MENFDDKYKKKNPFSVPNGYFDTLSDRIMEQVQHEGKNPRKRFLQLKPYLRVAAVFVVALLAGQFLMPVIADKKQGIVKEGEVVVQTQDTVEEDIFDSQFNPTSDEIIEYLASEVDSYELMYAEVY